PAKTLRLWDAATAHPQGPELSRWLSRSYSVAFSPDGRRIVSGSADTVRGWRSAERRLRNE
ncbi:hypothetical protein PJP12_30140, partial [Mycobacterium kansasii]